MDDTIAPLALALMIFLAGCWTGSVAGHHEIGRECRLLGSFYVGERVFECREKK